MRALPWTAVIALVIASALFGAVDAMASDFEVGPLRFSFLIAAGATLPLLAVGNVAERASSLPHMSKREILVLALLNIAQASLFVGALLLAPVGPVAAIHLGVPVVYLIIEISTRSRRLDRATIAVLLLVVLGAVLAARADPTEVGGSPLLGILLAVGSVLALAAYLWLISTWGRERNILEGIGLVQLTTLVLLVPSLLLGIPRLDHVGIVLLAGAVLIAPAILFQWWALPRLAPVVFGVVLLSEAVFAAAFASLLFDEPVSPLIVVAGVLLVMATAIEIGRRGTALPDGLRAAPRLAWPRDTTAGGRRAGTNSRRGRSEQD